MLSSPTRLSPFFLLAGSTKVVHRAHRIGELYLPCRTSSQNLMTLNMVLLRRIKRRVQYFYSPRPSCSVRIFLVRDICTASDHRPSCPCAPVRVRVFKRQRVRDSVVLMTTHTFASFKLQVMECLGSALTNKYAEGVPGAR